MEVCVSDSSTLLWTVIYTHSHVHIYLLPFSPTHSLLHTLTSHSDDEDASVASRRAALYSTNTVTQITSKKDAEPDRMEIDNSFGELCHTTLYAHRLAALLDDYVFTT